MADIAVTVEDLGKRYRIGSAAASMMLRDQISAGVRRALHPNDRRSRDYVWALEDVSFEIRKGQTFGVIGANGAGKSTLLKIMSRITDPTTGFVDIDGSVGSLLEVGTGFHHELTGRENVYFSGAILGMRRSDIANKFDEIVAFAEVERFIDTPVKWYSSGMLVRLGFAVAAHLETDILLVDEVLSVGDAAFQRKCLGKAADVVQQGRTVCIVSHQLGLITSLCDEAILLTSGRVLAAGSPADVVNRYLRSIATGDADTTVATFERRRDLPAQIERAHLVGPPERGTRFDALDELALVIDYEIAEALEGVAVHFSLRRNGDVLFVSFDSDTQPSLLAARAPGRYRTAVRLPCPLKPGAYSVEMAISRLNVHDLDWHPDALTFDVEELTFDPHMRSYSSKQPGPMAVLLPWTIDTRTG
jgi:lipopolysaccharide transport system ATP-binding protein